MEKQRERERDARNGVTEGEKDERRPGWRGSKLAV